MPLLSRPSQCRSRFFFLAPALLSLAFITPTKAQTEKVEPPEEFVLEINGKPVTVTAGKEFSTALPGGTARLKLSAKPERTFNKFGVRFRYPRQYAFEAETEPDLTVWNFTGTNTLLMVQKYPFAVPSLIFKTLIDGVTEELGPKNVRRAPLSVEWGGRKFSGVRLHVNMEGQKLVQDYISFGTGKSSFVILVQDVPDDKGKETAETAKLKRLLKESLSISSP